MTVTQQEREEFFVDAAEEECFQGHAGGWVCSLPKGHSGDHRAMISDGLLCKQWSQASEEPSKPDWANMSQEEIEDRLYDLGKQHGKTKLCGELAKHAIKTRAEGIKYDSQKPEPTLVPPNAIESVIKILTFGAQKYSRDGWKSLDDLHRRYLNACLRHLLEYQKGNPIDDESGMPHLAHAVCSLLFVLETDIVKDDELSPI